MRAKILSASAGSGKTYQLAYKYVRDVIENPTTYRNILAVTFTNKATEEMKSRILKEIHTLAAGERSNYTVSLCDELSLDEHTVRQRAREVRSSILHDYSHFSVLTIDTFFQRILRAFIKELGIDLNFSIELDGNTLLNRSADAMVEEIATNRELQRWLTDFMHERMDNNKRWDIRDGILALGNEIFKERNKEAVGNACPKEELKRIAQRAEGRSRASQKEVSEIANQALALMSSSGVEHGDFSRSFTKFFVAVAENPRKEPTDTVRQRAESTEGWFTKKGGSAAAKAIVEQLREYLEQIIELQSRYTKLWNTAELISENFRGFALLSDLYDRVLQMCEQENLMLLSETKYLLSKFIADNDAPFIYEKVGARYERFMIDEFQDTSLKEWHNFLPLLHNAMSQSEDTSVLLVGDVKQSIYRWRGGDWKILGKSASENLGHENTSIVNLNENWRSLPQIVGFNNDTIERVVQLDNGYLNNELDNAVAEKRIPSALANELQDMLSAAYRGHAQHPRRRAEYDGYVNITLFDEKPPVIERIKQLLDKGFRPKDIMILVRDKAQGVEIARTLLDFKQQNSDPRYIFDVMTQEALVIGTAPIVKFIISVLSLAVNPDDGINRAIYRRYDGSGAFENPLSEEELRFLRSIRLLSPEAAFEQIVMHYALAERDQDTAYIQALHEHIVRFCIDKVADIALFLKWWEESDSTKSMSVEQSDCTIEITTIHKAKGLEKPVIIIPFCNWKLDPRNATGVSNSYIWANAEGDEEFASLGTFPVNTKPMMADSHFAADFYREKVYSHIDNINLLYVALTRAAESLHIFIPTPSATGRPNDTVGRLLLSTLPEDLRKQDREGFNCYEFGEFTAPCARRESGSAVEHQAIDLYNTVEADMRLRLPSQRYFEDDERIELSPRNFGILMHRAFAEAKSTEDIYESVEQMVRNAVISPAEGERLRHEVGKALDNPMIAEWFGSEWNEVRNENDIIVPHGGTTRRPDRVMIKGRRAVIVDYKFGEEEREKYAVQLRDYMALLSSIGYTSVEGYIWYVRMGRVVRVE